MNKTTTEATLRSTFESMLLGVHLSTSLTEAEKQYITELLQDQLDTELMCLEMCNG